jgi:hypothetical protein
VRWFYFRVKGSKIKKPLSRRENTMRTIMMIVGVALGLVIMASGISYAEDVEYAGVYKDAGCYIGGATVNQDMTCPHGYWADSTNYVETPSGKLIMTCHFDENIPEDCLVENLYMNKDFGCWITYRRDDGTPVSVYTLDSVFIKTPGNQAMLRCTADLPPQ